jgi:uncharacterized protein
MSMYIIRFLVVVLAVWAAILILRQLLRSSRRQEVKRIPGNDMVRCARCGLHIPTEEAVRDGEHYYCSERHRLADRSSQ